MTFWTRHLGHDWSHLPGRRRQGKKPAQQDGVGRKSQERGTKEKRWIPFLMCWRKLWKTNVELPRGSQYSISYWFLQEVAMAIIPSLLYFQPYLLCKLLPCILELHSQHGSHLRLQPHLNHSSFSLSMLQPHCTAYWFQVCTLLPQGLCIGFTL